MTYNQALWWYMAGRQQASEKNPRRMFEKLWNAGPDVVLPAKGKK